MSSGVEIDKRPRPSMREETQRIGRHRRSEPVLPSWALEQTGVYRLPGEETAVIPRATLSEPTVQRPPTRAPGAAMAALSAPVAKPEMKLLGRCLRALRLRGRS